MSTPQTSRPSGDLESRSGETTTAQETKPGPCPACGHHGPRKVLCADPDCRHGVGFHKIRTNGSIGACDTAGERGKRCPCTQYTPTEETPHE